METLKDFLEEITKKYSNKVAVTTKEATTSYRQLDADVGCIRGILVNVVLPKDKNYAILMSNTIDSVKTFMAIVTLGHTAVIIPDDINIDELIRVISVFNVGCVIYDTCFSDLIREARRSSEGTIFLSSSNLFDEYVDEADYIDPESTAVIMLTKDDIRTGLSYEISHKDIVAYTKNDRDMAGKVSTELKSVILLSVTKPLGLIRSFLSGLYRGGNLYFCGNEENMYSSIMYFKPDLLVVDENIATKLLEWFTRENAGDSEAPSYLILESPAFTKSLKEGYESLGTLVLHEVFTDDSDLLEKLSGGES